MQFLRKLKQIIYTIQPSFLFTLGGFAQLKNNSFFWLSPIILLLYRDSYYKIGSNNELEITVTKNRSGSTGKVTVN
ncbi:hypothetical protein EJB00_05560 [Wolbachia endosymbiont of Drosophila mauritiana]|nr:hypothetical protein EJA99_05575 [Wolbachia endosymbiont of Drosophila mauritiana]QCB64196.1 hypothetical protein EJB00_05560 [Wolbachia endosymbiont of Drosophila mauritiana]TGB06251.1 hypothetical protein E5C28_04560 [Wolbachia endosymbiont of Drosophila mauritiana]